MFKREIIPLIAIALLLGGFWLSSQSKQQAIEANLTGTTSASNGYLSIPELGIRLKVDAEIEDALYKTLQSDSDITSVALSSKALSNYDARSANNNCSVQDQGLGSIIKTSKGPIAVDHIEKNINGTIVAYAYPTTDCSTNPEVKKLQQDQVNALKKAFDQIEPLN
jgi:hypothetical protein